VHGCVGVQVRLQLPLMEFHFVGFLQRAKSDQKQQLCTSGLIFRPLSGFVCAGDRLRGQRGPAGPLVTPLIHAAEPPQWGQRHPQRDRGPWRSQHEVSHLHSVSADFHLKVSALILAQLQQLCTRFITFPGVFEVILSKAIRAK